MKQFTNNIKRFVKKVVRLFQEPFMKFLPGQIAFFFIMSVIPLIALVGAIASNLSLSVATLIELMETSIPEAVSDFIISIISGGGADVSLIALLIFGIYLASNGPSSIIRASNLIYNFKQKDFIRTKIKSIIMAIVILSLFVFLLVVPIFGGYIIDFLGKIEGLSFILANIEIIYLIFKWPLSLTVIFLVIKIIYTMAPSEKIRSKTVNIGAIFTSVLWMIITEGYTYYVSTFNNYDLFYGSISNLLILLFWFYLLSYVLVLGMALNASILGRYDE